MFVDITERNFLELRDIAVKRRTKPFNSALGIFCSGGIAPSPFSKYQVRNECIKYRKNNNMNRMDRCIEWKDICFHFILLFFGFGFSEKKMKMKMHFPPRRHIYYAGDRGYCFCLFMADEGNTGISWGDAAALPVR